ncbi:MAG: sulfur carrier protein ThiS adenylyltransferase ThiF, partial [Clostridia bacterium]|nr:sulfur carrier protein ThiS adenylyltransferase ThiF [Clostridia bacterium]
VVEAFDNPVCKAELVNTIIEKTDKFIVASSGMAGIGSSNDIKSSRAFSRLYICGDSVTGATEGVSLMSPRVNICAGHQANMVVRLLLGETEC